MPFEDKPLGVKTGPAPRRERVLKSAGWIAAGHGLGQLIRLASSIILTRFLAPEVYGLMELAGVFYAGLMMFSDVGLGNCIVHSQRGEDPDFLSTAWTLQILRGVVLVIAASAVAVPASSAFAQPDLRWLIPALSVIALVEGFDSTAIHVYARRVDQGPIVRVELALQLTAVAVQVAVAMVWPTVWAIVFGSWAGSLVKLAGSHLYLDSVQHRLLLERAAASEIWSYGRWIFGSTALHFISNQGDRLIFAALVRDISTLGVYAIAVRLKTALSLLHFKLVKAVVFPALSERGREAFDTEAERVAAVSAMFYKVRLPLDLVFVGGAGLLFAVGRTVVDSLYTERYAMAGPILQVFALELGLGATFYLGETLLFAIGETKYAFYRSAGKAIWIATVVPAAYLLGGFWWLVGAVALSEVATGVVAWRGLIRHGFFNYRQELRAAAFFVAGVLLGHAVNAPFRALFFPAS